LEKGRLNIQNQFDQWYNNLHARENLMASTNAHESFYKEASSVTSSNAYTTEASMSTNSRSIAKEPNDYKLHSSSSVATNSSMSTFAADSKDSSDVNDDILAFYQAKEELLKRKGGR